VLAHDRSFPNRTFFHRFLVVHALLRRQQCAARLNFLLKASDEFFVGFLWILFEVDHNLLARRRVRETEYRARR